MGMVGMVRSMDVGKLVRSVKRNDAGGSEHS